MALEKANEYYMRRTDEDTPDNFLTQKGIHGKDVVDAFRVGFTDGDLGKRISPTEYNAFKEAGLIKRSNNEVFKNGITIGLTDSEENIIDIFHMNMQRPKVVRGIGDEIKGFGNIRAMFACDDLIVTEHPLIAMQLMQKGYKNVVLVPNHEYAKQIRVKKATVLTYAEPKPWADAVNAREVYISVVRDGCESSALLSLERAALYKADETLGELGLTPTFDVLQKVDSDLDKLGYVGESINKKILYLVTISRLLPEPLSAIAVSASSAGKTTLMRSVCKLCPEDQVVMASRVTEQGLFGQDDNYLEGKVFTVDERYGSASADYSIRTAQTSQKLVLISSKGNKVIKARFAYMESTTSHDLNPENANRCLLLSLDESPQATRRILEKQRDIASGKEIVDEEKILKWHHAFHRSLKTYQVHIPFVGLLTFPVTKPEYRREQPKLFSLIKACALMNQHYREVINGNLIADVDDYRIAHGLYTKIIQNLEYEVSVNARMFLDAIEALDVDAFTVREAISATGWSRAKVDRTILELCDYDYISYKILKHGKKIYSLEDYHKYGSKVELLVSPDELVRLIKKGA